MKTILFLLLPVLLFAQFEGDFYLEKNTLELNKVLIDYFTTNLDIIKSVGGKTKIKIAYQKQFLKNTKTTRIDDFFVQWEKIPLEKDVRLFVPKTKYIEFDFKNKKIKRFVNWSNNDNDDFKKPKNLKEKVKKKKIKP